MLRFALVVLFAILAFAFEDAGVPQLTNNYIQTHALASNMDAINNLLQNPAMNTFYHEYYSRPQETQRLQIEDLTRRARHSSFSTGKYPYANQVAVNPNVVQRLVSHVPRIHQRDRIEYETRALAATEDAERMARAARLAQYQSAIRSNASFETARLRDSIMNMRETLRNSKFTSPHPAPAPFEKDGNLEAVSLRIAEMEKQVKAPLTPMQPNPVEIAAVNRLSAQMEEISKAVHVHSVQQLHQDAHAQDVLLEQLAAQIRRLSNTVEEGRRNDFHQTLHSMLHKYHLHDHKFINTIEGELDQAIKENKPLAVAPENAPTTVIPSPVTATTNAASTVTASAPVAAVTGAASTVTAAAPVAAVTSAVSDAATTATSVATAPIAAPQTSTDQAKQDSNVMKKTGEKLLAQSKELETRANIQETRARITQEDRDELLDAIRKRFTSPPAQVHAIGSAQAK